VTEAKLGLLDIALDHLTLGRAALYRAILEHSSLDTCHSSLDAAVSGLRRAGPESAQSDLDEAWEIAERGPMPLFQADIHLYRARLFGTRNAERGVRNEGPAYPWDSPQADLAAARQLIESCGYWRRKEELEDAEQAAKSW
jgi:hypothetical protein